MATVLVVEDEQAQRRLLELGLTERGHRVVAAASGAAARLAAEHESIDVALVDLGLPDIDGIELCRRLKVWPGCPIIVVSAEDADASVVEALEMAADDYVVKRPVRADNSVGCQRPRGAVVRGAVWRWPSTRPRIRRVWLKR